MNEEQFPMLEDHSSDGEARPRGRELDRRQFLSTMGATTAALASTTSITGCIRKPVEHILPYSRRPEDLIPGRAMYFATAMNVGGSVEGLLVESQDGRPTKIEGNPRHPGSQGGASAWAQAWVASLYDADRGTSPIASGAPVEWAQADAMLRGLGERLGEGEGTAFLVQSMPSPTFQRLLAALRSKAPKISVYHHDLMGSANSRAGTALVGGAGWTASNDVSSARVLFAVDSDFLQTEGDAVRNARGYATGRDMANKAINRLYSVEARHSLTGTMADHRLRLRSSLIGGLLRAVAANLANHGVSVPGAAGAKAPKGTEKWAAAVAEDLAEQKGAGLILVGERQPPDVHALGHAMNAALGNFAGTVRWVPDSDTPNAGDIAGLSAALQEGAVERLLIFGGNPAYDAPADLDFAALVARVPLSVHLGENANETSAQCTWYLPQAHGLESWGDLVSSDGAASIVQPLIAPLHGEAKTGAEVVARLLGDGDSAYDLVRATWKARLGGPAAGSEKRVTAADAQVTAAEAQLANVRATSKDVLPKKRKAYDGDVDGLMIMSAAAAAVAAGVAAAEEALAQAKTEAAAARDALASSGAAAGALFDTAWRRGLHDGVIDHAESHRKAGPTLDWKALAATAPAAEAAGIELDFVVDTTVLDGRLANLGWMQEMPDPVTKLTWDNAAVMSAATAESLGATDEDLVHIRYNGRHLVLPALTAIGIADGSVVLQLGYGREVGRVAAGVGANVGQLRTSDAPWFGGGATVSVQRTLGPGSPGRKHPLAVLQEKKTLHINGTRRPIARVGSLADYEKKPDFVVDDEILPAEKIKSLWTEPNVRDGHQWGMTVDLNSCTGCNACAVACQSENNISFVGKRDVLVGREMHWIRIDRYFDGDDDEPLALSQPMPCLQCENAPCEQVCPVGATTHSPDGLNDMAYNRCIGTRYCANNCPTKVRRFNYRNYAKQNDDLLGPLSFLQRNPDVTVRFRGVIEKCTYCVQRVNEAKIDAKREGHGVVPDGTITPACAQSCPTKAIVFGDVNDPASAVSKSKEDPRNYDLFREMNLKGRTSFKARIRNPNPKLS
jgi:molybdopterin-containing oxidoreductase family iron-sulfur binding subunit